MTAAKHYTYLPSSSFPLQIYKNLFQSVLSSPHSMDRPHWWQEFTDTPVVGSRHKDMAEKEDTRAKL